MNQNASFKERRLYPRRPIRTEVVFENDDREGVLYFFSTDISTGGIFIESDVEVPLGAQVFLRFSIAPFAKPIQATGEVVRIMRDEKSTVESRRTGLGIRFIYMHPLDRQMIQDFIGQG